MKEVKTNLNRVSKDLISENQIKDWLNSSRRPASLEKAKRNKREKQGGMPTRKRTTEDRNRIGRRNEKASAAEKRKEIAMTNANMD